MNFWEGFDPQNNFFTNLLRKNYNVLIDDNPNYLFYSVYSKSSKNIPNLSKKGDFVREISPEVYIILRKIYSKIMDVFYKESEIKHPKGNFIKIFYGAEKVKPDMSKCDFAFSIFFEEEINHPHYMRIPTHVLVDFLFGEKETLPLKRKIDFNKIKREKVKFCNFIYSQDVSFRNKFFKQLSKYKRVDSPGRCMNNMPPIGSYENAKKSRISLNWTKEKLNFIKDYKFTIAFENEIVDGYTTEKLVHPLLVNSIPIYFGNKKVGRDFNKKSFINCHDFRKRRDFINYIIKVDNDEELYKQYLKQPIFKNKEQYFFNSKERIIKRLNEIIESKK